MRAFALVLCALVATGVAASASAQANDPYAFCYVDPPTYRSGTFVYTRVRFVGSGPIDQGEVAAALADTSRQVVGRQVSCWRYPSEPIAEAKRQEGMARERSRSYVVLESEWMPSRVINMPVAAAAPEPEPVPELELPAPATAAPVAASAAGADSASPGGEVAPAAAPPPAPAAAVKPAAPDPQAGAVANLNAGILAAEAARLSAAAQAQADYQRRLAEQERINAENAARYAKERADYEAAVKACAAGDFSKCGGPPVQVKPKKN